MSRGLQEIDRGRGVPPTSLGGPRDGARTGRRHRLVAVLVFAGLTIGALCGAVAWRRADDSRSDACQRVAPSALRPAALVGHEVARFEEETLAPGASRAWQEQDGLHQVDVVVGALVVVDAAGNRDVYGAGQGYVGGWDRYVRRNDGAEPVTVSIRRLQRLECAA